MVTAEVLELLSQPFSEDACAWLREIAREKFQQSSVSISPRPLLHRRLSIIAVPLCGSTVSLISFLKNEKNRSLTEMAPQEIVQVHVGCVGGHLRDHATSYNFFWPLMGCHTFTRLIATSISHPRPLVTTSYPVSSKIGPKSCLPPMNLFLTEHRMTDARRALLNLSRLSSLNPPRPGRKAVKIRNWEMGAVQWRASRSP